MQFNLPVLKLYKTPLLLTLVSCVLYAVFAYDLERTQYVKLVSLYTALFGLFYWLLRSYKNNFKLLTAIAFLFRAVLLLAIPNLSQDFYRFIWDGRMILEGFNPYVYTVTAFIEQGDFPVAQARELYHGMGTLNAGHYTNYPPINQLCFIIAGLLAGKSILGSAVVLRVLIIAADFGTLYFGKRLLERLKLPVHNIFWYVLNPFIIIELTGNLHFEGVMIFFLVWSLYLLHKGKWYWAAVVLALSVSTKLIPLIFLPLFLQWFTKRNVIANSVKQSVSNNEIASSQVPRNDRRDSSLALRMTRLIDFFIKKGGSRNNTSGSAQGDKEHNLSGRAQSRPSGDAKASDEMLKRTSGASVTVQHDKAGEIASSQVPRNDGRDSSPALRMTKLIGFYAIVGGVTLLLFAPFFSTQFIENYAETVALWFQYFEFNASLYYVAREIGYTFRGYNEIAIIGSYIPYVVIAFVLILSFFRKNRSMAQLITAMLLALSFYYFTATTVHPWYVATLLALSVFTRYKFPLVWSFVIILSYLAYIQAGTSQKSENLLIIAIEYLVVYGVFFWDIFRKKSKAV